MTEADPEYRIVQKIGNFTSSVSRNGLKMSQLTLDDSYQVSKAIGSLVNDRLIERVEETEHRYRLTEHGWEEYDGPDL